MLVAKPKAKRKRGASASTLERSVARETMRRLRRILRSQDYTADQKIAEMRVLFAAMDEVRS